MATMDEMLAQAQTSQQGQPAQQGQSNMDAMLAQAAQGQQTQQSQTGQQQQEQQPSTVEQLKQGFGSEAAKSLIGAGRLGAKIPGVSWAAEKIGDIAGLPKLAPGQDPYKTVEQKLSPQIQRAQSTPAGKIGALAESGGELLSAEGIASTIGYGGKNLTERILKDPALKGLDLAKQLDITSKILKVAQQSPEIMKMLKIGAHVLETPEGAKLFQMATGAAKAAPEGAALLGGQEYIRSQDVERTKEAAKTGAVGGALVGAAIPALGMIKEGVKGAPKPVEALPPTAADVEAAGTKSQAAVKAAGEVKGAAAGPDVIPEDYVQHIGDQNEEFRNSLNQIAEKIGPDRPGLKSVHNTELDDVRDVIKDLSPTEPVKTSPKYLIEDPETPGSTIVDEDSYNADMAEYNKRANLDKTGAVAIRDDLRNAIKKAQNAAKSGAATGKAEGYLKLVKQLFDKDMDNTLSSDDFLTPEGAETYKNARRELFEFKYNQKQGPAKNIFNAPDPQTRIQRLAQANGPATRDAVNLTKPKAVEFEKGSAAEKQYTKNQKLWREEVQNQRQGVMDYFVNKNTNHLTGETDYVKVRDDLNKSLQKGGAQELFGDTLEKVKKDVMSKAAAQEATEAKAASRAKLKEHAKTAAIYSAIGGPLAGAGAEAVHYFWPK